MKNRATVVVWISHMKLLLIISLSVGNRQLSTERSFLQVLVTASQLKSRE